MDSHTPRTTRPAASDPGFGVGLPAGGPFAARVPVVNIVGRGPGFGPSDVVFPGEAAARFLLWRRHRERVLEWTGWWGSVLVPFGSVRASSVIDGDVIGFAPRPETGLPPTRVFFAAPDRIPTLPAAGGVRRGRPVLPAPVPLPGGFGPLFAAISALVTLGCVFSGRDHRRAGGPWRRPYLDGRRRCGFGVK